MVEEYRQDKLELPPEDMDLLDESEELQEAQQEQLEAAFPQEKEETNRYNFFWKIIKWKDSTKFANLNNVELGTLNISVREAQKLGLLGHIFHHKAFGNFWFDNAEIINSTSMARQGWLLESTISQKKFTTRARKSTSQVKEGWRLFQKKKTGETEQ